MSGVRHSFRLSVHSVKFDWNLVRVICEIDVSRKFSYRAPRQPVDAMKTQGITESAMAEQMFTSGAQLDRQLNRFNKGVTLETLQRAARIVGREVRLELV